MSSKCYYDMLKIDKCADKNQVKKAYLKLAKIHHPDKGGDEVEFKNITEAYNILYDDEKRVLYDRGGREALENNGMNPHDIFSNMFGGGMGGMGGMGMGGMGMGMGGMGMGGMRNQVKKGKPIIQNYNISLEELYMGIKKKIRIKRKVIDKNKIKKCTECDGKGSVIKVVRMGPMIQQMQSACPVCNQQGYIYKYNVESEIVYLEVSKGSNDQKNIILNGKGDDIPNGETGDLHIKLCQKEHPVFKRKGSNLFIDYTITLTEALCGFKLDLQHLDNRKLLLKSNKIINPKNFNIESKDYIWKKMSNTNCSLEPKMKAKLNDLDQIKEVIENGQLRDKNIVAFVIDGDVTNFYTDSYNSLKDNLTKGSNNLYIREDTKTLLYCVEGEGMPLICNPTDNGNLYIDLKIEFPEKISEEAENCFVKMGLGNIRKNSYDENSCDIELHSIKESEIREKNYELSDDEDEFDEHGHGQGQGVNVQQCAQQ